MNRRTDRRHTHVRERVSTESITRVAYTATDLFRPQSYFRAEPWRGTWAGEGGGALLSQYFHQLDLLVWICGRPASVWARCGFGSRHAIETEDEITAVIEWPNGALGTFVASTSEPTGTNRLEIVTERGTIEVGADGVREETTAQPAAEIIATSESHYGRPESTTEWYRPADPDGRHSTILANFAAAILHARRLSLLSAKRLMHSSLPTP